MPPHSVVLSVIGACLLWVGWFGFNAGSALAAGSLATSAFVATHFGAAAAALGWSAAEWLRNGKASVLGAISGAVAGLVAITPAAGLRGADVRPGDWRARGRVLLLDGHRVKSKFGYDDSLDAFGVHGAGGTLGRAPDGRLCGQGHQSYLQGRTRSGDGGGLIDGHAGQVLNQFVGVAIAWVLAVVGTLVILKVVDWTVGLRVTEEQEIQGLDLSQHGEEGYNLEA